MSPEWRNRIASAAAKQQEAGLVSIVDCEAAVHIDVPHYPGHGCLPTLQLTRSPGDDQQVPVYCDQTVPVWPDRNSKKTSTRKLEFEHHSVGHRHEQGALRVYHHFVKPARRWGIRVVAGLVQKPRLASTAAWLRNLKDVVKASTGRCNVCCLGISLRDGHENNLKSDWTPCASSCSSGTKQKTFTSSGLERKHGGCTICAQRRPKHLWHGTCRDHVCRGSPDQFLQG